MEKSEINGEKFARRLRRQRHIGSLASCDSLTGKLLALHYARLLVRSGAAAEVATRPPAAPAPQAPLPLFSACDSESVAVTATVLRQAMRVCSLAAVLTGRLPFGRSTCGGASGASQRGLRPHCNPASFAGDDASAARYTPHWQRTRASRMKL